MANDWSPYVVQQGDHVQKLAFWRSAKPDDVWGHAKNKDLAARRKSMDMLCPGDVLHLPAGPASTLEIARGAKNRYQARVPTVTVRFTLDAGERDIVGKPYEVHGIAGHEPLAGTIGGGGEVELELPVWVREVEVRIPSRGLAITVGVGGLDPVDERSGVEQRLRHLGFLPGDGAVSEEQFSGAVAAFQRARGLTVTGEVDPPTLDALESDHKL